MRWLLLAAIHLYWLAWPQHRRRQCLFDESCSRFVYRRCQAFGAWAGIVALRHRLRQCRPGYVGLDDERGRHLQAVDGTLIPEAAASQKVWREVWGRVPGSYESGDSGAPRPRRTELRQSGSAWPLQH